MFSYDFALFFDTPLIVFVTLVIKFPQIQFRSKAQNPEVCTSASAHPHRTLKFLFHHFFECKHFITQLGSQ
jgi:hypothetical protein